MTPDDHERLQAIAATSSRVADYLHERDDRLRAGAPVLRRRGPADAAPPPPAGELFDVWEVRNGARAPELNPPAAIYVETHGGTGVGGSDDHAGVDIGRTWTETPRADDAGRVPATSAPAGPTRAATRAAPRSGRTRPWRSPSARSAAAAATPTGPDPRAVLRMVERVLARGRRAGRRARDRPRPRRRPGAAGRLAVARSASTTSTARAARR